MKSSVKSVEVTRAPKERLSHGFHRDFPCERAKYENFTHEPRICHIAQPEFKDGTLRYALRPTPAKNAGTSDSSRLQLNTAGCTSAGGLWLELRRLPPIMGFVGSGPGLVIILA